ncbi:MAG: OmpP1/FadL family transporter [Betaproteobacteria bacterium]
MKLKALVGVLAVAGLAMPGIASATNGYFSHGYGMTAKGMAGAATAMTKDTFGGANNPASMVWVGDRMDIGVDWFSPIRSAERTGGAGQAAGLNGTSDSGSENFLVPEFGYNMMMGEKMSLGVTVYGNGGMNTDYSNTGYICSPAGPVNNMLCGSGKLGVDLMQLIIAPTLAYKVNEKNSIGVSPLLGYQRFKMEGVDSFGSMSQDPSKLTNNGYDSSTGYGLRVGYMGKLTDTVTIGAAYATKMRMGKFDKYKGLFAEDGGFDMPENYNLGIAVKATPAVTVALDYQRINYSGIKSIANSAVTATGPLGAADGPGFGWQDVDVVKLGVEYAYSNKLTLRAGYSHTNNPISSSDVTFNILAPAVIRDHYTLGFTYGLDKNSEITMAYMHAAENDTTGTSLFAGLGMANPDTTEKIKMYENSLGIAYSKKF